MKTVFMSGISARVKRWVGLMNAALIASLLVLFAGSPASAAVPSITPMVQCVPFLDTLTTPLQPLIRLIGGGIAGLIIPIAAILIVAGVISAAIKAFRGERLSGLVLAIISVVGVVFAGAAALILLSAVVDTIYSSCSRALI